MIAVRLVIFACVLSCGCGRFGFNGDASDASGVDSMAVDPHLRVADGWSIAPLVDFSDAVAYKSDDFQDGDEFRDNAPRYVAALYPPFDDMFVVIAGRSLLAIAADGAVHDHNFRPSVANDKGPDGPGRATFLDLGDGRAGLWMTSATRSGGDGLYLISNPTDWSFVRSDSTNNTYAIAADPEGSYDGVAAPALYVGSGVNNTNALRRWRPATALPEPVAMKVTVKLVGGMNEAAVMGGSLYVTVDDDTRVALERIGPGPDPLATELASLTNLTLAEGSTARGLFALRDDAALVEVNPDSGALTVDAWTDDPAWQWVAVSAPRPPHPFAGQLIVLESSSDHAHHRLLRITPP